MPRAKPRSLPMAPSVTRSTLRPKSASGSSLSPKYRSKMYITSTPGTQARAANLTRCPGLPARNLPFPGRA